MDALILDGDYALQLDVARALTRRGCTVICVDSVPAAEAFVRMAPPDILVMGERVDGRLTHPVALLAECEHPGVAIILLSDRADDDMGEVFDLLPAVRAVCGRDLDVDTIGQMMLCVTGPGRPVPVATVAGVPRATVVKRVTTQVSAEPLPAAGAPAPDPVVASAEWRQEAVLALDAEPALAPVAPAAPADPGHQDWRAALGQVTIRHLPAGTAPPGAPRAAWWEDWEQAAPIADDPPRRAAGGRRMSLG